VRTGLEVVPERIRLDVLAALAPRPPPAVPRLGPRLAPDVPRPPSEPPHDAVDLAQPRRRIEKAVAQVERKRRGRKVVRVEGGEASREGADGADAGREGVEGGVGGGEL